MICLLVSCFAQAQSRWEFPEQQSAESTSAPAPSVKEARKYSYCYAHVPPTRTYAGRAITSPNGAYRAQPLGGEDDSMHLAVQSLKGAQSYATSRGFHDDFSQRKPWVPATEYISGFCWHPTEDVLFTSTMYWSADTGVYRWDLKTGKVKKIVQARTKRTPEAVIAEYLDDMIITNVSKDGRYLMMSYEPNAEAEDSKRKSSCYIIDTQDGSWTLYRKFKKLNPTIEFADAFLRTQSGSDGSCPW